MRSSIWSPATRRDAPRLRRLSSPVEHHPLYWEFLIEGPLGDIAADLVGPNVKFHHQKLNFKWAEGGEEVKWHQDIQFFPHTDYSVMTIGVYLYDCGDEQGPLGVLPGSHEGPLYDQYNERGEWVGCLSDAVPRQARSVAGGVSEGTGRVDHHPQLPHGAWLAAELVGHRPAAAADGAVLGGCVPLHAQPADHALLWPVHPRPAGADGQPRPPPLPRPAGLVGRLFLDLRPPAGRGMGRGAARQGDGCADDATRHAQRRQRTRPKISCQSPSVAM